MTRRLGEISKIITEASHVLNTESLRCARGISDGDRLIWEFRDPTAAPPRMVAGIAVCVESQTIPVEGYKITIVAYSYKFKQHGHAFCMPCWDIFVRNQHLEDTTQIIQLKTYLKEGMMMARFQSLPEFIAMAPELWEKFPNAIKKISDRGIPIYTN